MEADSHAEESMDKKKEIIVFSDGLGNSGVHRVTSELTDDWVKKGHSVILVYLTANTEKTDYDDFFWNKDIEYVALKTPRSIFRKYLYTTAAFWRILRKHPNAVAVSLSVMSNFVLGFCSPLLHNQVVLSDRNDPTRRPAGSIKQKVRNWCFKRANTIILQTEDVKAYYFKHIGRTGIVIPNPVNNNLPAPYEGERDKVIVTASRLNKQKNIPVLIQAFAKLHPEFPDYTLKIYGRGEEEEHLRNLVDSLGLSDSIRLEGFCNDIFQAIQRCSMYVCSSDYEGISNALLEAMALGMPVISTDCPVGGARLLIDHYVNGVLVGLNDAEGLYTEMKHLIEEPDFAKQLGLEAQAVRKKYAIETISQRWIDTFR